MSNFDPTQIRVLATGLKFPEGPIALDDGSILVVEIEGDTVARILPDGSITRFPVGRGPNGQALGPDGCVYVATDGGLAFETTEDGIRFPNNVASDRTQGAIYRLNLQTGEVATVFEAVGGVPIGGLNDIVFDSHGCFYVVDTMMGQIYYGDPSSGEIAVVAGGLIAPNGLGLSPDGGTLYVSETFSGELSSFVVKTPGSVGPKTVIYSAEGAHGFDGLGVDGAGNICVANLAASGVSVIAPDGKLLDRFKTPENDTFVTNICFGGSDGNTAFICSAGRGVLYSVPWPWPGLRLNYAA